MFDSIAQTYGVNSPQVAQAAGALPNGGWYDPTAAWDKSNPLAGVKPLMGLKYYPPEQHWERNSGGDYEQVTIPGYVLSSNGTRLPATPQPDGTVKFTDTYDDPAGKSDRDKLDASYTLDPKSGAAIPTAAASRYQAGEWVTNGQPVAQMIAAMAAAYVGGTALAGAGGGGGGAAAAGAGAAEGGGTAAAAGGAAGGGMSSADLAALYGTEGYGAAGTAGAGAAEGGAAGAAGGAAGGGLSSADTAALYGSEGYGAGGGAAGGAGGAGGAGAAGGAGGSGGSSGGFLNSLASGNYGDAATAAGNWATSANGMQTIGGLASSYLQSNAASNALEAQTNATNSANALQKYMYDTNRADWAPYRALGAQGTAGYSALLKDPNSITSDPGYQFGLNQGQTAVDRSEASKGSLYSGATLKALQRYGQDYGSTKLNDAFGRYSTAAQLGATGTSGTQSAGTNYANQASANTTGLGNAAAGNALLNGNLWGNALNGAVSAYKNYNTGG